MIMKNTIIFVREWGFFKFCVKDYVNGLPLPNVGQRDLGRPPKRRRTWTRSRLKGLSPGKRRRMGENHVSEWGITETRFSPLNQYWIKYELPTSTKIISIIVNVFETHGTGPTRSPRPEIKIFNTVFHCFLWFYNIMLFCLQNNCIVNLTWKDFKRENVNNI